MNQSQYNQLFSFLWNIANDVLVQAFEKGKYKEIIMPMLVLRRLDILLEPTKEQVLERKALFEQQNLPEASRNELLKSITRLPYFNVSPYTMKSLRGEPNSARLLQNFRAYLNGFSDDVQDIIGKFDLMHHAEKLNEVGRLGAIIEKFTDERINLGITPVVDNDGNEILPALDNHTMGTLFEELLRRFNEENNVTEAGEHFTPRDYVNLLADLAVLPIAGQLKNSTYEIYDGACGTGGILSIVADRISKISAERGLRVRTNLYGQELQPDTFATCKADLMLSEQIDNFEYTYQGERRNRIAFGSTISQDGHANKQFDFCISNPPFGTPWKRDLENWGLKENQKKDITDIRFKPTVDGELLDFVPGIGDPQMLFLANNVSRMKESEIGTRIVEVHNGRRSLQATPEVARATCAVISSKTICLKLSLLCPKTPSTTPASALSFGLLPTERKLAARVRCNSSTQPRFLRRFARISATRTAKLGPSNAGLSSNSLPTSRKTSNQKYLTTASSATGKSRLYVPIPKIPRSRSKTPSKCLCSIRAA